MPLKTEKVEQYLHYVKEKRFVARIYIPMKLSFKSEANKDIFGQPNKRESLSPAKTLLISCITFHLKIKLYYIIHI